MIDSPILIVGSARSGKSLLGNFLSLHQDTCWFSNYSERFPRNPEISCLHRMINLPIIGKIIKKSITSQHQKRFLPRPTEGEIIYHDFCNITRHRIANEQSLKKYRDDIAENIFIKSVCRHIKCHGGKRFITDQSDNTQRIRLMNTIFSSPYIIHVIRDGRAVAHEVMLSKWWQDVWIWWYGKTPRHWIEEGRSSLILSGHHWVKNVDAVHEDKSAIGDRYLEVRYEELTSNPKEIIKKILSFCNLKQYQSFTKEIPSKVENYNFRWKNELSLSDIIMLEKEIGFRLASLGYI